MDSDSVIQIVILVFLLLLSGFFSAAETSLSLITKVKLRAFKEDERKNARVLEKVLENYDRVITTILISNNIVNLSASALTTVITLRFFGNAYVSVATGILTFLVLIFGEIVPKTFARRNSDSMALAIAPVIRALITVILPVVFIVEKVSSFVLLIMGQSNKSEAQITESELRSYMDVSRDDGVIEVEEHQIINNVFDFSDSDAKDIMIPRIDMTMIEDTASYHEVMKIFRESMYTRLPVYHEEKERIIGFINIKDLIRLKNPQTFKVSKFVREAYYTYEYKKTNDLLLEMRQLAMNLAFVNNEYGETVGMITLEDLLEEIVGQIRDEYDADERDDIKKVGDQFVIAAKMKLEDINDEIGTTFSSEDYDTIGGLVLDQLDRLPEDGEEVTLEDGTVLKVQGIRMNRIDKVLVTLSELETESEEEDKNN